MPTGVSAPAGPWPLSRRVRAVALVLWILLLGCAAGAVAGVQRTAKRELDARFTLRAAVGARFVESYVLRISSCANSDSPSPFSPKTSAQKTR